MNNQWNQFIYRCWSPFYDVFFNNGIFHKARRQVFHDILFKPKQRVLFVGIGTGVDLAFIPYDELQVEAIDYSDKMLQKARDKYRNSSIKFLQMDAQILDFESNSFDIVVASLLLSVVPNPNKSLKEMIRVTKDKGTILIFDKFEPTNKRLSFGKRMFRPLIKLLGTDIGLSFESVYENVENLCEIQEDVDVMMKGLYRKIILRKKGD
ncbi:methyltransferase domain-containing protein [Priestia megaterium]|uniref:class I SAM-dependent methyltransferase n=1 Tax=Priestia megaterium TaxID=1404 RepID=UPI001C24FDF1|nr:methyltransferase domain-containing protein [Priestia megaterium]MBU8690699.1 methyltransferase domain-containing protein [Priestia megaterium]